MKQAQTSSHAFESQALPSQCQRRWGTHPSKLSPAGKPENAWSIVIPWKDEPVKEITREELIMNYIDINIDILEPILIIYDK